MARIRIEMPPKAIAAVNVKVRITDINYGNHVGNDSLVGILHEARMLWLQKHGYTELNLCGVGLIMNDLAVEYKNESFFGDVLSIILFVAEISHVSFELYYSVSNQHGKTIARAKTGMVCFNYAERKVSAIPPELIKLITGKILDPL